jgi:hypothetical protein
LATDLRAMADNIASVAVNVAGTVRRAGARALPTAVTGGDGGKRRKRRTMSAEARARISAAQKARWAKKRADPVTVAKGARKGKRGRKGKGEATSTSS